MLRLYTLVSGSTAKLRICESEAQIDKGMKVVRVNVDKGIGVVKGVTYCDSERAKRLC